MSTTSLTLHERAWLPLEYIRTVGPLTGVTAERLRDALIGLHAADPTHRAVSRLDRDRRPLAAHGRGRRSPRTSRRRSPTSATGRSTSTR